jgi:hypothetical protein
MTTTARQLGGLGLSVLLLAHGLGGCAEMSEGQKGATLGTATGAATGALVGAIAGKGKGAAIGALAGAVVGGLVGWQIGEYRARKTREGPEAAAAYKYTPQQGIVAKVEKTEAAPATVRPGEQIVLHTDYTILAPSGAVKVKEVRTLLFNGQELGTVEREVDRTPGTYTTEQPLALPADAVEGTYVVQTAVRPVAVEKATPGQASSEFRVGGATAVSSSSRSQAPSTPRPGEPPKPSTSAESHKSNPPGKSLSVTVASANLRAGPGTTFKILATATRGARLELIESGGKESDRWYKVRLSDGREAWIAASVVSAVSP